MIGAVRVDIEVTSHFLGQNGQRAGFVLLAGFLGSWLFIRTSARLIRDPRITWWPGSVETKGGLHIHHLVWGICTVLISGFLGFTLQPSSPGLEILAGLFGVGAGLTLDEFALWLRLQDVYWSDEGRESVDAVVVAVVFAAMVVVGVAPFDLGNGGSIAAFIGFAAIQVACCAVCAIKGKGLLTLIGAFIPLVGLVGAIRLAKPGSPWARRRYAPGSGKLARAQARFARVKHRRTRFFNLIAGAPSEPDPAPVPDPQPKG